jgi:hypothetical protein
MSSLHHENPPYLAETHTRQQQFTLHCTSHVCYTQSIQLECVIRVIQCNATSGDGNGAMGVIQLSLKLIAQCRQFLDKNFNSIYRVHQTLCLSEG